jgi:hypothetical protein
MKGGGSSSIRFACAAFTIAPRLPFHKLLVSPKGHDLPLLLQQMPPPLQLLLLLLLLLPTFVSTLRHLLPQHKLLH